MFAGLFLLERGVILPADIGEVHRRRRKRELEIVHRVSDHLRHCEIAEPLMIRRDHVPGGVLLAGRLDRILERLVVLVPERALGVVRLADLPVAMRIVEPLKRGRLETAIRAGWPGSGVIPSGCRSQLGSPDVEPDHPSAA
jgi:hypothetical protein